MRARALALGILSSTAVLAVGWQIGTHDQTSTSTEAAPASEAATEAATTPGSTPVPSSTPTASPSTAASGSFTGTSVQTRFGDVQVQVTVENGTITDVIALQLTDKEQKSVSISNRAAPVLRQEVLAAQSANVQSVSGATYTSDAYLTSLQAALDQAGL